MRGVQLLVQPSLVLVLVLVYGLLRAVLPVLLLLWLQRLAPAKSENDKAGH